jgi:hypothetical protein
MIKSLPDSSVPGSSVPDSSVQIRLFIYLNFARGLYEHKNKR